MNNTIFPCLLYDGNAKQSADFYCRVFDGKILTATPDVIYIEVFGQSLMLLNGPGIEKNASVSFLIQCETLDEVHRYWNWFLNKGTVIMPLDSYPWSTTYGWIQDHYGTSWQVILNEKPTEQKIVPTFMFVHQNNGQAMEAMTFYTKIFPNSSIENIQAYKNGSEGHEIPDNIQHAHFIINDYHLFCMDSSYDYQFDFNEGISMAVITKDQEETDYLWNALISDGGNEGACGWLKDKYGFSWQIAPQRLIQLIDDPDKEKAHKVMQAMMKMKKIILKDIEEAYTS